MQRVFIGIPVDQRTQSQINELLGPVRSSTGGVRWVPEQNRHITLAFLGNRPAGVVEGLARSMDQVYQEEDAFTLGPSSLVRFPNSSGNIIALLFKANDRLARLYQLTQELLVANGFKYSRTQFRPHITLGRIKKRPQIDLNLNRSTNISLQIGKVTFYQSTLSQAGSTYLALNETILNRSG